MNNFIGKEFPGIAMIHYLSKKNDESHERFSKKNLFALRNEYIHIVNVLIHYVNVLIH